MPPGFVSRADPQSQAKPFTRAASSTSGRANDPIPISRAERRSDRWFCNPKGIVSSSPARVAESARLPWVSVRAIFNPNDNASPLHHRATTPLGLADTPRFSQGSSRLATLGFGTESLWDSALGFPKGRGSNPGGSGLQVCVTSQQLRPGALSLPFTRQVNQSFGSEPAQVPFYALFAFFAVDRKCRLSVKG